MMSDDRPPHTPRNRDFARVRSYDENPPLDNPKSLREWWHNLIAAFDRYPCVGMLLALPSDEVALEYFEHHFWELDILSGKNCLILALSGVEIEASTDVSLFSSWSVSIANQTFSGFSLELARYFGVDWMDFPALLLFRDIRSTDHYLVSLKGLDEDQIVARMRWIFHTLGIAVEQKSDPLLALNAATSAVGIQNNLRSLAQKTLETAFETVVKVITEAMLKPKP